MVKLPAVVPAEAPAATDTLTTCVAPDARLNDEGLKAVPGIAGAVTATGPVNPFTP